ncbi:MAG TPA: response regulator transcription factor [Anaerolineae bacterium]|nr:response regulator transcription factor [Anaerolineae bacterium]
MGQRVLVVDDDKEIVRILRAYLAQAGYTVLTAYDGETALHVIRSDRPDLIVLDLMLPDRDGWDITRIVRTDEALAATPIIMLTARVESADRIRGLDIGADDYIPKPFDPHEVVARVRAVLRRASDSPTTPHVIQNGGLLIDVDRHEVQVDGRSVELTPTEFDLLKTLMDSPGHAFTRLALIEQGLGFAYEGMERTLDSHIRNLRRKIEPDPANPTYIKTVFGVGYRMAGPEPL